MKRFYFFLLLCSFTLQLFASDLVLIRTSNYNETKGLFNNPALTINYFKDHFVIATLDGDPKATITVLDQNAWTDNSSYYLVYLEDWMRSEYYSRISGVADVLFDGGNYLVVKIDETLHGQLPPGKNDGTVRLYNKKVTLPSSLFFDLNGRFDPDPFIVELLGMVSSTNITATVQHLQDYTTRNCYKPQGVQAQNWIKDQFEGMGLSVEIMDFPMSGGPASDNVIATKLGTKYPNEFIVLGGHYDSLTWSGAEPGADDNASGTAGVMEVARILSQYEFDRTIIFCAFSGEEYGLYGSEAYAERCAQQGMNILGYFNMDMVGYLQPGDPIHTDVIAPQSAQELVAFYTDVCSIYLPDFIVGPGALSGGDSDHTSFNNAGYMGIFPFEDSQNYSPYIHTSNDIIGPSYNNAEQAGVFTQAILASVVTMANWLAPPQNLVGIPGDGVVDLQWDQVLEIDTYKVYRNGTYLTSTVNNSFQDEDVTNGTVYEYYVTCIYSETGEESNPSNIVTVTPMPPISLPLTLDFENGAPYWNFEDTWGISSSSSHSPTHSISESPTGQYGNNLENYATLNSINLAGYATASVSFWTKYDLESGYDYMWLEVSTNGQNWTELAEYNGTQNNWQQKTYSLNAYIGQPYVVLRFHFYSDVYITKDGMYIDDFQINVTGGGVNANFTANTTSLCENGQVQFTDNSTGGVTSWSWQFPGGTPSTSTEQNPLVTYSSAGIYDVTLEISNGTSTNSLTKTDYISVMSVPGQASPIMGDNVVGVGETETYTTDLIPTSSIYNWVLIPDNAGLMMTQMNSATITWSATWTGVAILKVCGMNDCGLGPYSADFEVTVSDYTGVKPVIVSGLDIYPNPAHESLHIKLPVNTTVTLEMINTSGKLVLNTTFNSELNINTVGLPKGIYSMRITGDTFTETRKVIIN